MRIFRLLENALVELLNCSLTRNAPLTERVFLLCFDDGSFDSLAIGVGIVETLRDPSFRACGSRSYQYSSLDISREQTRERTISTLPEFLYFLLCESYSGLDDLKFPRTISRSTFSDREIGVKSTGERDSDISSTAKGVESPDWKEKLKLTQSSRSLHLPSSPSKVLLSRTS